MPSFLIQKEDSPTYAALSFPDKTDFAAFDAALNGTGVVSGGVVAPLGTPGYAVQVSACTMQIAGAVLTSAACAQINPAAASTHDRRDIVVCDPETTAESNLVSVGAWAASTAYTAGQNIAIGGTIYACSTAGTTGAAQPAVWPSVKNATVTDGTAVWTVLRGVMTVTGTPCSVAGWTVASAVDPPVKPSIPAGLVFLGEYYVPGGGGNIVAANIGSTGYQVVGAGALTVNGVLNIAGGQVESLKTVTSGPYSVLTSDTLLYAAQFGVFVTAILPAASSTPVGQSYTFTASSVSGWSVQTVQGGSGTPATVTVGPGQALEVTNTGGVWYITGGSTFPKGTGTNPSGGLAIGTRTIVPGTAQQINATSDSMLYLPVTTGATLTISMDPTSAGSADPFCTSLAVPSGSLLTFRIPIGWYFLVTTVSGAPVFQTANYISC